MRVFVTGASGFVGSAVVADLVAAGHQVLGLVRSDRAAAAVVAAGAEAHRGDLEDLASVRAGAARADAVIHTAFIHDFARFPAVCAIDRQVIDALGDELAGSDRRLIVTSATGVVNLARPGHLAVEADEADPNNPRSASEQATAAQAARGVHATLVRLPPTVHGAGDPNFVPILIKTARDQGVAAQVGAGANRWSAVHRLDAARCYRLALERGVAGARYHAVAEEGIPFHAIAGVIGRHLGLPVASQTAAEAADYYGWFNFFATGDIPASSQQTRDQLGWQPEHLGLIADLDEGHYFAG